MSSVVAVFLHAIRIHIKMVPCGKSSTKRFAWTNSMIQVPFCRDDIPKIQFFCSAISAQGTPFYTPPRQLSCVINKNQVNFVYVLLYSRHARLCESNYRKGESTTDLL